LAAVPSTGRADHVSRIPAPEADATRALYERYANQIFGYCLHQLGSREEAEDAVQSTFLNAFRGLKRGVVPEMESAWLFKIAHNVCLSRRRSTWRRGRIESPADFEVVEELAPAPARRADELIGLQDVLETMPENQRRAILLREWQGLSYHEIANELELSQSAVETLIFRARRSLAAGLEQPPEKSVRKRVRRAAGDLGNVLAGIKSMLLGSAAAVKVAATVAVISATTVVAAAPVAHHQHHSTPRTPASTSGGGVAGTGSTATSPASAPALGVTSTGGVRAGHRVPPLSGADPLAPSAAGPGPSASVDGGTVATDPAPAPAAPEQQQPPQASQPSAPSQPATSQPQSGAPSSSDSSSGTAKKQDQSTAQDQSPQQQPVLSGQVSSGPITQVSSPVQTTTSGGSQSGGSSGGSSSGGTSSSQSSSQTTSTQTTTTPTSAPRIPVTTTPPSSGGGDSSGTSSGASSGSSSSTGPQVGSTQITGGPLSQRAGAPSTTTPGTPSSPTSSGTTSSSTSSSSTTTTSSSSTSSTGTKPGLTKVGAGTTSGTGLQNP